MQRVDHPHVVRVFAWGRTPDFQPYIAMEYLEGHALSTLMGQGKTLPIARAAHIGIQILDALSKAHSLNIIHRDLKPDNVLLVRRDGDPDYVKVLDFGIAKLLGKQPHEAIETVRGVILGTPAYLPPELALPQGVSPSTDLYALGVMLFEAVTGRLLALQERALSVFRRLCPPAAAEDPARGGAA